MVSAPEVLSEVEGGRMPDRLTIDWRRDFDAALEEAGRARRHVLLDFSAAPM